MISCAQEWSDVKRAFALAIVFFAAASACSEKTRPPTGTGSALADSADQVMFTARFNLTDRGLERAQLEADRAYFFDESTRVELENVKTTFYTVAGERDAILTSKRGTYSSRMGNMVARGNVLVISETGRRLTTQELRYDQSRNEIASDSAFVLTEPGRRLEGICFRADPNMNNVRVLKAASGYSRETAAPAVGAPAAKRDSTAKPAGR
jgi:LPS export ABC transporter protein LptC